MLLLRKIISSSLFWFLNSKINVIKLVAGCYCLLLGKTYAIAEYCSDFWAAANEVQPDRVHCHESGNLDVLGQRPRELRHIRDVMYMYPLGEIHWVVFKHFKLPDSRGNQMTTLKCSLLAVCFSESLVFTPGKQEWSKLFRGAQRLDVKFSLETVGPNPWGFNFVHSKKKYKKKKKPT